MASEGDIPPEADLSSPAWFTVHPTSGPLDIGGRVAAVRSSSYSYRVEWTTGLQAPLHPGADQWRTVAERSGLTDPVDGTLATLDLAQVAAALPGGGTGTPSKEQGRPDPDRFTVRVRVVVTDAEGRVGTMLRHLSVHDDPDAVPVDSPPAWAPPARSSSDLDGDGADELVVATDEGSVHARRIDGSAAPGFPVRTPTAPYWHAASPTALADGIEPPGSAVPVGAPAVADMDGDGTRRDRRDRLRRRGARVAGGRHAAWHRCAPTNASAVRRTPTAATGPSGASRARRRSATWTATATWRWSSRRWTATSMRGTTTARPSAGFPVLLVDPAKISAVDPDSHQVTFANEKDTGQGGELIATPTLADLTGDGRPEIVVGAQEQYSEPVQAVPGIGAPGGNTRLYAISPDGTNAAGADRSAAHPDEQAYVPGWPVPAAHGADRRAAHHR